MYQILHSFVVLVILVFVAACGPFAPISSNPPAQENWVVTFVDLPLKLFLRVPMHQTVRMESGLLQAKVKLENFMDTDRWVDIQVIFRDKDGFELEKTNWEPILLQRRKITSYQVNSLSSKPEDYRVLIRDPKG